MACCSLFAHHASAACGRVAGLGHNQSKLAWRRLLWKACPGANVHSCSSAVLPGGMEVLGSAGGPHWGTVPLVPGCTIQAYNLAGVIQLGPRMSLADPEKNKREFKHTSLSFLKQIPEGGKVYLPLSFLPRAQSTYSQGNSSI